MSTIADKPPRTVRNFNLRAYIAGGAATVALIGAGVLVFGSLAAYVAFNGLPVAGGEGVTDSVAVQTNAGTGASAGASAALGAAPGAVAESAAAATAVAPPPGATAGDEAASAPAADGAGTDATFPGTVPPTTDSTATTDAPPTATTPPANAPGSASSGSGPVGSAVEGVDDAVAGAGVDVPLSETAGDLTAPVDETLDNVGGTVEGLLGN